MNLHTTDPVVSISVPYDLQPPCPRSQSLNTLGNVREVPVIQTTSLRLTTSAKTLLPLSEHGCAGLERSVLAQDTFLSQPPCLLCLSPRHCPGNLQQGILATYLLCHLTLQALLNDSEHVATRLAVVDCLVGHGYRGGRLANQGIRR